MTDTLNTARHNKVFDPENLASVNIDVIGAGATGSEIVLQLAKLGLTKIRVFDHDTVEAHNIANQLYGVEDIGKLKTEALKEIIQRVTGAEINIVSDKAFPTTRLDGIVFLLTDDMESREAVFKGALNMRPNIKRVFETRIGLFDSRIYHFNPCDLNHSKKWLATLCSSDEVVEESGCGSRQTIAATIKATAGVAISRFMDIFGNKSQEGGIINEVDHEVFLSLNPLAMMKRTF